MAQNHKISVKGNAVAYNTMYCLSALDQIRKKEKKKTPTYLPLIVAQFLCNAIIKCKFFFCFSLLI